MIKKSINLFIITLLAALISTSLYGCNRNNEETDTYNAPKNQSVNTRASLQVTEATTQKQKVKPVFKSKEHNYRFEYPSDWTRISNWKGERNEIFVDDTDSDLISDPRQDSIFLFIDHNIEEYELRGWQKSVIKEIQNPYGMDFSLEYYIPNQNYFIERGAVFLAPGEEEVFVMISNDHIPGAMHFKYDTAKNEFSEVDLMEILNSMSLLHNE